MAQGLVTFAGIANIVGGEMTFCRGVQPSCAVLRSVPSATNLDRKEGTLVFSYGTSVVTFPDAAVVTVGERTWYGRDGWRFDIKVADRRWKWRYHRINGCYNRRAADGTIHQFGKKSANELVKILLDSMGETAYDVTAVSSSVYPPCLWNRSRSALELQWICDLLGLIVVLGLDNIVRIKPMNDTAGDVLPVVSIPTAPTNLPWKGAVIPEKVQVQGDPTVIQSSLTLAHKRLDGVAGAFDNWSVPSTDWPEWMLGVSTTYRPQAHFSGYRWFQPDGGWDGDGVTISDFRQLELLDRLVEVAPDLNGELLPLPPVLRGDFYMYDEMGTNAADEIYTGNFRIHPGARLVETDKPLFQISGAKVVLAAMKLLIAYRVKEADSSDYARYTKELLVSSGAAGSGTRVVNHPELTKHKIVDGIWDGGIVGSNSVALDSEADVYLDGVEQTYRFGESHDVPYDGIVAQELDGAISQISFAAGNQRKCITRVGRFTEFDIYTLHHQQRRAQERLFQMVERMSL